MGTIRAEVCISGRVQGVSFRYYTQQEAEKHAVSGWCRNRADGSVEAVFEGQQEAVRAVVDWCRQGPEYARVDNLEVKWSEATGDFSGFAIRH